MFSKSIRRQIMSAVVAIAGLMTADASAQSAKKVINAMALTTYPPFEFKDEKAGKVAGFNIDVLEAMAKKIGAEVAWTETSYALMISFAPLNTKRADILLGTMGDTPERRANANFLDYVYSNEIFYTLSSKAEGFANLEALCGKHVAATRSSLIEIQGIEKWSAENCVRNGKPAVEVVLGENTAQNRLLVQQGRADAAITGEGVIAYQNKLEGNQYAVISKPIVKLMTGFAFAKDNLQLGEELKTGLAGVIADGTYGQLLRKWGLTDQASIGQPTINGQP
ncbi:transporter substrate-binding domain-containing protein [Bradyrhizobium sp. CW1]|uniref:transporter substrate-binding domain-containing protein n=1 Tax=Bradyrhizobium sp. CW1 TaxID=2782686 RepID=UPI0020003899|nr:transporter substrate-binding domain-containing protein [Bradyrhizobium sp. CW1]UPJ26382.1 transporter substrate-binding domain-containing protein [Bradyrhizobium sp. CW1]